mmetsp:Transcript_11962/g.22180  ORF Transcript_11962/g.22180 Transcript_11962/m.22180 type:complete len:80 (+) Transcript_11962:1801-2040(+)
MAACVLVDAWRIDYSNGIIVRGSLVRGGEIRGRERLEQRVGVILQLIMLGNTCLDMTGSTFHISDQCSATGGEIRNKIF